MNTPTYIVQIYATFGSEFQEHSGIDSLRILIECWKSVYEETHRDNAIDIEWIVSRPKKKAKKLTPTHSAEKTNDRLL